VSTMVARPIVLMEPQRAVHPPSWLEHVPFAFWLMEVLRPRVFVELGTQAGNSYSAFAQATQHLGLDAAGYSIDTWKGDPQAGFYPESVYADWKEYHDRHFSGFSTLIRATFDEAVQHFSEASVDLLNIDGFHTCAAVLHDFETWLPRMSKRGVVLFHDINVRERDFGAWQAWQRIREPYPSFEFLHGYGLGVLAVGSDLPEEIEWLTSLDSPEATRTVAVRQFFSRIGSGVMARYRAAEAQTHVEDARRETETRVAAERENHAREEAARAAAQDSAMRQITMQVTALQEDAVRAASQLAERDARIEALNADATHRADEAARLRRSLEVAKAETTRLTTHLIDTERGLAESARRNAEADTRIAGLEEDCRRLDASWNRMQLLADLRNHAVISTNVCFEAASARARNLSSALATAREPGPASGTSRLWSTARALGVTPSQLVRRPRNASTLFRLAVRPRALRDAHRIAQSGLFDPDYYARTSPDVAETGANMLAHFVITGGREGRRPCALFDSAWYLAAYPDVAESGANPLAHYLRVAMTEDRDPHPLFSSGYYRAQLGTTDASTPLAHYVTYGMLEGRSPHPLFDPQYYVESVGTQLTWLDPFAHFIECGAAAGFDPHPLFNIAYYRSKNPEIEASGQNPLLHYLSVGTGKGRRPHPLFDPDFYRRMNPDIVASHFEPLTHYVTTGGREGRNPVPEFDAKWYLATYPDVAHTGANPLIHYLRYGWLEWRNPSATFDTVSYLMRYSDAARTRTNPLVDYVERGPAERSIPAPAPAPPPSKPAAADERVRLLSSSLERSDSATKTIVCLTHVMPVFPRAGNEYRIHRMLRWLRQRGYVVVPIVAPIDGSHPSADEMRAIAEEFGNAVLCLPTGRVEYILRDVADVLQSLDGERIAGYAATLGEDGPLDERGRELLQMDRAFCSDALIETVLRLQSTLGRYVLLAEYIWMSRVLPLLGSRALKIIDTIDVFSTRAEKVEQYGVDDINIDAASERLRLERADVLVAIQENERRALEELAPGATVVTGGVDFDVTSDAGGQDNGPGILYVASGNPMNRRGLRDFLRFAWPRIRESVPNAELSVVGAVGESVPIVPDGVRVLGRVADLAPLYRACRLVINPAVAGTGVKVKTLEALSYLRPVVAWPNGVDGLSPAVAGLCKTARDWFSFSDEVTAILKSDRVPWFSPADRAVLVREAAPDRVYRELTDVIEEFFAEPSRKPAAGSATRP
jgi:Methyltransferase domain/Glycosyl transferases group 1